MIWALGDSLKSGYYVAVNTPIQLVMSAFFQLLVDLLILFQFYLYNGKKARIEVEMEIVKSTGYLRHLS